MRKNILIVIVILMVVIAAYMIVRYIAVPKVSEFKKDHTEFLSTAQMENELTVQEDEVPDEEFVEYLKDKYSKPEAAIEYLFSIALRNDVNDYPNAFTQEQISKDLFEQKEPDKEKLVQDILLRLTRDGTLTSVNVIKGMMVFEKSSIRIVCDLYYRDLDTPIRVNIKVKKEVMEHNEHDQSDSSEYFYIDSSVWDIIRKIENGR